jgi:hypothetical protein
MAIARGSVGVRVDGDERRSRGFGVVGWSSSASGTRPRTRFEALRAHERPLSARLSTPRPGAAQQSREERALRGLLSSATKATGPLPVFSGFLGVAAFSDAEIVKFSNIVRECGVSSHTTKNHFQIPEDTLLGRWLPAYRKRPKRRVIAAPKFYFADVGIVNQLAKRGELLAGSELYGKAFESWVFHELTAYVSYRDVDAALSCWRLASGIEVDFVLGDMQVAVEAKSSERITRDHLKGLRSLIEDDPRVGRRIVVCREPRARTTEEGIEILPLSTFVKRLWAGELVR